MTDPVAHLKSLIRDIPDFPKKGVMFRDITPLLSDASGLALSIELLANPFRGQHIDLVIGAESRGCICGTAVACCLSAGFGIVVPFVRNWFYYLDPAGAEREVFVSSPVVAHLDVLAGFEL